MAIIDVALTGNFLQDCARSLEPWVATVRYNKHSTSSNTKLSKMDATVRRSRFEILKDSRSLKNIAWAVWTAALFFLVARYCAGGVHRVYAFNDYVLAGHHWILGEYLYGNWRGFIYSPIVAAFFAPSSILPPALAYLLWLLLNGSVFLTGLAALLESDVVPDLNRGTFALIYLLLVPCALGNLDVGQANPLVIGLLMFAVTAVRREQWNIAAACVGLATFFKIYPLAVGMLICVVAPRRFTWRLLLALLVLALAPYLLQHWSYVTDQYKAWITTRASDNRLNYSIKYAPIDLWFLVHVIGRLPISAGLYSLIQIAAGGLIAIYCMLGKWKAWNIRRILCGLFFLVSIWMPLCGPSTEAHTYLLMAPALVIALVKSFHDRQSLSLRTLVFGAFFLQMLHTTRINYLLHAKQPWVFFPQPLSALLFLTYCLLWLLNDSFWGGRDRRMESRGLHRSCKTQESASDDKCLLLAQARLRALARTFAHLSHFAVSTGSLTSFIIGF
jgi:Glycosyltransferase family 87